MSHSNASRASERMSMTPARAALASAEAHLRAAQTELCTLVASIAVVRGWDGNGETYEATPAERRWHDRIRRVVDLVYELEEGATDVS